MVLSSQSSVVVAAGAPDKGIVMTRNNGGYAVSHYKRDYDSGNVSYDNEVYFPNTVSGIENAFNNFKVRATALMGWSV